MDPTAITYGQPVQQDQTLQDPTQSLITALISAGGGGGGGFGGVSQGQTPPNQTGATPASTGNSLGSMLQNSSLYQALFGSNLPSGGLQAQDLAQGQ